MSRDEQTRRSSEVNAGRSQSSIRNLTPTKEPRAISEAGNED